MKPRFALARFHHVTGPKSLFDRIRHVMARPRTLKTSGPHFRERSHERGFPTELLRSFDPKQWTLTSAEVRVDSGKFVSSTWAVEDRDRKWWVVIGLHDCVETVIEVTSTRVGLGDQIVQSGTLYEFVDLVNRGLMAADT